MSISTDPAVAGTMIVHSKRRWVELFLLILAWGLGFSGYLLTGLNTTGAVPENWRVVGGCWLGLILACHIVVRIFIPYADPMILPIVFALNGLGLAMIHRIDLIPSKNPDRMVNQAVWTLGGVVLWAVIVIWLKDHRRLQRFPYILFLAGLVLMLMPLLPVIGQSINGARLWIGIGPFTFQPAELAKVLLVMAFASYLVDKRDVLSLAGHHIGPLVLPRARDLGPLLVMWGAAMVVIMWQNDLGTAMLFFGLFVAMLYIATERVGWVVIGALLFSVAAVMAYKMFGHVRVRVSAWLDPFSNFDQNDQVIKAQYGMAWGGLSGRGWGLGRPGLTTFAWSDFISSSIGEELGVTGLMAIIVLYGLLVARGMRAALSCRDSFGKLLASGLSFVFGLQVFAIIGGVTRLLPLTGLTTPFMSQGGSSEVANWALIAILMLISHQARRPADELAANVGTPPPLMETETGSARHADGSGGAAGTFGPGTDPDAVTVAGVSGGDRR
jgi:cell division protein FtsW (lipid II flippase)